MKSRRVNVINILPYHTERTFLVRGFSFPASLHAACCAGKASVNLSSLYLSFNLPKCMIDIEQVSQLLKYQSKEFYKTGKKQRKKMPAVSRRFTAIM